MSELTIEKEGAVCNRCGEPARYRTCKTCGESAWIIDCGHYDQPRPIAADEHGEDVCDDCYEEQGENQSWEQEATEDATEIDSNSWTAKEGFVGLHVEGGNGNREWYVLSDEVYSAPDPAQTRTGGYLRVTRKDDGTWVVDDNDEARGGIPQGTPIGTSGYVENE